MKKQSTFLLIVILIISSLIIFEIPTIKASDEKIAYLVDDGTSDQITGGITTNNNGVVRIGGYWYCVYYNSTGTNCYITYRSSQDGETWGNEYLINYFNGGDPTDVAVFQNETHIVVLQNTGSNSFRFYHGTANSGVINWDASAQTISITSLYHPYYTGGFDANGYFWISYHAGTGAPMYIIKNSVRDGTWATDTGFPFRVESGLNYVSSSNNMDTFVFSDDGSVIFTYCSCNTTAPSRVGYVSMQKWKNGVWDHPLVMSQYRRNTTLTNTICSSVLVENKLHFAYWCYDFDPSDFTLRYGIFDINSNVLDTEFTIDTYNGMGLTGAIQEKYFGLVKGESGLVFVLYHNQTSYEVVYKQYYDGSLSDWAPIISAGSTYATWSKNSIDGMIGISFQSYSKVWFAWMQTLTTQVLSNNLFLSTSSNENGVECTISSFWYAMDYIDIGMTLTNGGYILELTIDSVVSNSSWVAFSDSNSTWGNTTFILNSNMLGSTVYYRVFANSSTNQWGISTLNNFVVQATLTFYFTEGGELWRNLIAIENGTQTTYTESTNITLLAVQQSTYAFQSFNWTNSIDSTTTNYYNFVVSNQSTVWAYMNLSGGTGTTPTPTPEPTTPPTSGMPLKLFYASIFIIAIIVVSVVFTLMTKKR